MKITFSAPIEPVAKARPRVSMRGGFARAYTPKKSKKFEDDLAAIAKAHLRSIGINSPLTNACSVTIEAFFTVPKSWTKKRKAELLKDSNGLVRHPHVSKPDLDNTQKSVLDALNGIVYVDDCQVCEIVARKFYSNSARLDISIEQVGS